MYRWNLARGRAAVTVCSMYVVAGRLTSRLIGNIREQTPEHLWDHSDGGCVLPSSC